MNKSRKWFSMTLAGLAVAVTGILIAPEADAGVRVIRTPSHHGYYGGGHCGPVYRPPVHHCSYALQQRRSIIGYDHCGRPLYQIYYVQVRTCGCR